MLGIKTRWQKEGNVWKVILVGIGVLCVGIFYLAMCLDDKEDEQEEMLRSRAEHYSEDLNLP